MAFTYVTLAGTFKTANGTACSGTVTFTPTAALTSATENTQIPVTAVTATLAAGAFSVSLLATDQAGITPTGWTYRVEEQITGAEGRAYNISLASSPTSQQLADLTPTVPQPSVTSYLPLTGGTLTGNLALSGSPALTIASGATSGYVLKADASGNASWGQVAAAGLASSAFGATGDIQGLGTAAAGATGEIADAGHVHSSTITTSPLIVTDGSAKQYRFRTSGAALDFDGAGTDMFLSVFSGYAFDGTQRTYARFESGAQLLHLVGTVEFATGAYAASGVTIDPATASITSAGKNSIGPITICGRKGDAGAPASGTWATGDAVLDSAGTWHYCTAGGTPGTWA